MRVGQHRDAGARMLRGALAGLALSAAYAFVCWMVATAHAEPIALGRTALAALASVSATEGTLP